MRARVPQQRVEAATARAQQAAQCERAPAEAPRTRQQDVAHVAVPAEAAAGPKALQNDAEAEAAWTCLAAPTLPYVRRAAVGVSVAAAAGGAASLRSCRRSRTSVAEPNTGISGCARH